jgi:hypothetical protein
MYRPTQMIHCFIGRCLWYISWCFVHWLYAFCVNLQLNSTKDQRYDPCCRFACTGLLSSSSSVFVSLPKPVLSDSDVYLPVGIFGEFPEMVFSYKKIIFLKETQKFDSLIHIYPSVFSNGQFSHCVFVS